MCLKFVLVEFQLPVRSETFGARFDIRHADKRDLFKTFNIFFQLQLMITLLKQTRRVGRRVRPRSLMKLQEEGYLSQRKLKFQPRQRRSLRTLRTLTTKMTRKMMRKMMRSLQTLNGKRRQLFRYL